MVGLAVLAISSPALARRTSQQEWGGKDFPFSCETVRQYKEYIEKLTPERRSELAQQFGITRKQMRQAKECLR
jgi:hypothetical protein